MNDKDDGWQEVLLEHMYYGQLRTNIVKSEYLDHAWDILA